MNRNSKVAFLDSRIDLFASSLIEPLPGNGAYDVSDCYCKVGIALRAVIPDADAGRVVRFLVTLFAGSGGFDVFRSILTLVFGGREMPAPLFCIYGPGGEGKSLLLKLLEASFGAIFAILPASMMQLPEEWGAKGA